MNKMVMSVPPCVSLIVQRKLSSEYQGKDGGDHCSNDPDYGE